MPSYQFNSIGTIHSCYKEKFGIPRQSRLVSSPASIEINPDYSEDEAFRELEGFSHIWVVFVFHATENKKWNPTVRPPRLGGNKRVGVFATRSMFRPNPIGLSVVELKGIERFGGKVVLDVLGGDFLDGTPVIDIKPYIPYADCIDTAVAGYAAEKPEKQFEVIFSANVSNELLKAKKKHPRFESIAKELLQLDPRPAYSNKEKKEFAIKLYDYDLKWYVDRDKLIVSALILLD